MLCLFYLQSVEWRVKLMEYQSNTWTLQTNADWMRAVTCNIRTAEVSLSSLTLADMGLIARIAWQVAPEIRVWCYYLIYWHVTRVTSCSLRSTNQHPDYFLHRGAHSSTHQNWSIYHSITHAHIIQLGLSPPNTFTREAWMELGKIWL